MDHIRLEVPATAETFDEDAYLRANADVAEAVEAADWPSGRAHFDHFGFEEGRSLRFDDASRPNATSYIHGRGRPPSRKVAIHAPPFSANDGGAIALHKLCDILVRHGVEACLVPIQYAASAAVGPLGTRVLREDFAVNPRYFSAVLELGAPLCFDDAWIVIYPEITDGNPLHAHNVARWLLHEPGFFTGRVGYGEGEIYFRFREDRSADFVQEGSALAPRVMTVNDYPLHLYNRSGVAAERSGTAYCMRKGRHRPLSHDLADSILIDGKEHEEISRIFKSVRQFISYDLDTAYLKLAALCGCDAVVVPEAGTTEEQWRAKPERRYGVAYGFDRVEWARSTAHLVLEVIKQELERQDENVLACIEDMNRHFDASAEESRTGRVSRRLSRMMRKSV